MQSGFRTLATLSSVDEQGIEVLRGLGISNLGDLLAYQPFRRARFIRAAADQLLRKEDVVGYLDEAVRKKAMAEILASPASVLKDLGGPTARMLERLGIRTIADLASYPAFAEAEEIIARTVDDNSDPFAPACVLPACKKFTRNSKAFASFFRQEEIRSLSILGRDASLIGSLFHFGTRNPGIVYLGYSVSYLQEWIYGGVHLGEPQGSVSLFMGQDTQVSVLDWRRINRALRTEDTRVTERLGNLLFHQRAVDEVARATAEEHQHGGTSSFAATAATAGSFVAAGAIIGGVGGGISGALAGLVLGNAANAAGAAPTLAGAAIGTAVGSIAGAAAGSLIFAGATTLGAVQTDAEGDREIFARSAQDIQQRTVQNSSSIRSFWSNIVSQSVQDEDQTIRTDRVTNHNRIHALNALYFEVLNEYRVNMRATGFSPILFLPFKPIHFTETILRRFWWIIRTYLADQALVAALDARFLALSSDPSPATQLAELPQISEVEATEVEVELNIDGSAMEEMIRNAVLALTNAAGLVAGFVASLFDHIKRDKIKVHLVTSATRIRVNRVSSPNSDPNFVGRFKTTRDVPIHEIEGIEITNDNPEFTIDLGPLGSKDINEIAFEGVQARIKVAGKASLRDALPQIGSLEGDQVLADQINVRANRSKVVPWDIAQQLQGQFEGIDAQAEELADEQDAAETTQAKLSNLLSFLNANKFGFTRLIFQNTEREQVISELENVEVGGVELSSFASTTPLGYCGNHVVLALKNRPLRGVNHDPIGLDTSKLKMALRQVGDIDETDIRLLVDYAGHLRTVLEQFLQEAATGGNGSEREHNLLARVQALKVRLEQFGGLAASAGNPPSSASLKMLAQFGAGIRSDIDTILAFIDAPTRTNKDDFRRLLDYYGSVKDSLADRMGRIISSDEISLPSPAVFMEPILSHAKGAELYDMRRNSHYEILPAPGIGTADPNVIRTQDVALTPNAPAASLTIQNAPEFPLPSSINAALGEAGKLDLSTLINSNAGTLTSTLSSLSTLAAELAKASAQLTGDAQKQALGAASEVAKQIGDIVQKSLQAPASAPAAPPAPKPGPPQTQQEKSEVAREVRRINAGPGTPEQKKEQKESVGAPVAPDGERDYQMSILFLDENAIPYPEGEFTLSMSFFQLGTTVDFNGGAPIPMASGQFFFPEVITLEKGRKATISVRANMAETFISGIREFTLPDQPDIVFKARMLSETRKISATDVKQAVDQVVASSAFGTGLNSLLNSFLNASIGFPFRIFKVNADGGGKAELNLRLEYNKGSSTTSTDTTGSTTVTEFEVVIPRNGWAIEVV